MMAIHSSWHELPRPNRAICPKLFFNFSPDGDRFSLRLTDLVAIWECSLDRTGIISTAKIQHTSIDPGESGTQLRVLLAKLQQSLEAGNNHLFQAQDSEPERLFLETNLDLPRPLKPLSWTFELEPQNASELAEQLLRPCLHEASVAKQKLDSLLSIIKDKDHVISRLLEKIESSQIDLSLIFPGITGLRSRKGSVTVKEAQKHIPGIAAFELEKWGSGFDNGSPYAGFDEKGMHNLVTGCEKCPKHTTKQHNDWLKKLDVRSFDANSESFESAPSLKRKASEVSEESNPSDTESDFERQPTPPHLKKAGNAGKQSKTHGSSSSNANSDVEAPRPAKRAKLGRLGGPSTNKKVSQSSLNNSSSPVESAVPSPVRAARKDAFDKTPVDSDTETATATASESEHDNPSKQTIPPPPSQLNKEKRKLGRLNSRSSRATSSSTATEETNENNSTSIMTKAPTPKSETPSPHKAKPNQLRDYRPLTSSPLSSPHRNASRQNPTETENRQQERDTKSTSTAPPTPSRRLGRLSRQTTSMSQSQSHSHSISRSRSPSHSPSPNKSSSRPGNAAAAQRSSDDDDTETETASATDTDLEPDRNKDGDENRGETRSASISRPASSSASTPVPVPEPEPKIQETAEQAANRRREELKQRLHGNNNTVGARKKRKF